MAASTLVPWTRSRSSRAPRNYCPTLPARCTCHRLWPAVHRAFCCSCAASLISSTGAGGGTILAQPFDPKRLEFTGDAVPIAEQVRSFGASPAGVIAFRGARTQLSAQLTWFDRKGGVLSTAGEIGEYSDLALSPDEMRVAYERDTDLWIFDFTRGVNTKFTFGNPAREPAWSRTEAASRLCRCAAAGMPSTRKPRIWGARRSCCTSRRISRAFRVGAATAGSLCTPL